MDHYSSAELENLIAAAEKVCVKGHAKLTQRNRMA